VHVVCRSELNLNEELHADGVVLHAEVVIATCASKVDMQGLVYQSASDVKLKHTKVKVDSLAAMVKLHLMIHLIAHGALAVGAHNPDFEMEGLGSGRGLLLLWLLQHDLEQTFMIRREFDHVVCIVVDHIHVC
jgi:hypothetical protein